MKAFTLFGSTAALALVCGAAGPALAQGAQGGAVPNDPTAPSAQNVPGSNAPASAQPQPALGEEAGDIIVTAQKTSETASRTPIALSVFSGETLKEQGITNVADLRNLAPSLEVGNAGQGPNIAIRGVSTTDLTSKGEQGVVFSIDNIPIGRPQIVGLGFFDLERVEVLRGPQGTLYGKSATGGAINVITAKPRDEFAAAGSVEIGNYNTKRGEAMINVPVSDAFAVRGAFSYNKRDGYLDPILVSPKVPVQGAGTQAKLNDEDNWTGRVTGRLKLGSIGSAVVTGTFGHIGGTGNVNAGALYYRVIGNGSSDYKRQVYYNPMAGYLNDHFYDVNGELNLDLGPVHLAYDGAHILFKTRDNKSAGTGDPAGAAGQPNFTWQLYDADISYDTHEVRLSNANPGRFTWLVGGNYVNEKIKEQDRGVQTLYGPTSITLNNVTSVVNCNPPTFSAFCNNPNPNILGVNTHKSEGLFGQASFEVVDRLKLTGGIRYSHDESSRNATLAAGNPGYTFKDAAGNVCAPPNGCVGGPNVGGFKGSKVTWLAGIDFQMTPRQLLYAKVSTGYKAGSFNDFDPTTGGAGTYGPEELIAYEAGYKGRILSTLQFNSSIYYYDYSKFQLTGATFLTPSITGGPPQVIIYTVSVPVKNYGWENELNWRPTPRDTAGLALTLANGKYNGYSPVGFIYSNRVDFDGKRLDLLPKLTVRVNYEHRVLLASGGFFSARVTSKYSSGYRVSDFGGDGNPFSPTLPNPLDAYTVRPQQYKQGSFTRTDLNVGYQSASGKLTVDVFVRNIEDDLQLLGPPQGINSAATISSGAGTLDRTTVRISDPRTFGVRLGLRY